MAEFERWLTLEVVGRTTPGLVTVVFHRNGVHWQRGYGVADVRGGSDVDESTIFRWFSVTKVVTAMAVVQLAERGQLALDVPVKNLLPWFAVDPRDAVVTVQQLLSHTSGLANPMPVRWVHRLGETCSRGVAFAQRVFEKHRRLRRQPGREAYYSNLGYLMLEAIVETVSGLPFDSYVRTNILQPAGMADTRFAHDPELAPRTAIGHEPIVHARTLGLVVAIPAARRLIDGAASGFFRLRPFALDGCGYGGLIGPVRDLVSLGQLHLRGGERVLSEATTRAMREPRSRAGEVAFGHAWWIGDESGRPFLHHGGGAGGYRAELRVYPEHDLGVAVLSNAGGTDTMRVVDHLGALRW